MMYRKPDDSLSNIEHVLNTESASQDDVGSVTVSSSLNTALDLAANESASLKNVFAGDTTESGLENTGKMQTMQSVQTETINTFQTSTADSTEFFHSSYYYIIEVRISLRLDTYKKSKNRTDTSILERKSSMTAFYRNFASLF